MEINTDEICKSLIDLGKELGAEKLDTKFTLQPLRFVVYDPSSKDSCFHIMPCKTIRDTPDVNKRNFRRTSNISGKFRLYELHDFAEQELQVCEDCLYDWNKGKGWKNFTRASNSEKDEIRNNFRLDEFFEQTRYYQNLWLGWNFPEFRDHFHDKYFLLYNPTSTNVAFHFMQCSHIRKDIEYDWLKTYRFTSRTSGFFETYSVLNGRESLETRADTVSREKDFHKVTVCADCLREYSDEGWKGFNNAPDFWKTRIRDSFDISEFFDSCDQGEISHDKLITLDFIHEHGILSSSVRNDYPSNWSNISNMLRASRSYRCEECGIDLTEYLTEYPDFIVTHHRNGVHSDIAPENLQVLCKECHKKQPYHNNTVNFNDGELAIFNMERQRQGIKNN